MKKLVFATNNANKLREIKSALPEDFEVRGLKESGIDIDIPEPHESLEENAREKADVIFNLTGNACFSEDTGLFVDALAGAPGVKSARYAGEPSDDQRNIDLLLRNLEHVPVRSARFRTIICLRESDEHKYFEGICEGSIITEKKGDNGFGYDPVFIPGGAAKTFAQMDITEKGKYSHRKKAFAKLIEYLNAWQGSK